VTLVAVAAVIEQFLPSITILYLFVSGENYVPVKVTEVPPVTVPYRGSIELSKGVLVPSYVTDSDKVFMTTSFISTATGQV
jgi:hypothetical protein